MLHLSDKELDRLSREAAEQYDPGLEHNPGTWEKLDQQLTGSPVKPTSPLPGGFKRFPFYYAPIVVLLVGVSYFVARKAARQASSKPLAAKTLAAPAETLHETLAKDSNSAGMTGASGGPPGAITRTENNPSPKTTNPRYNSTTPTGTEEHAGASAPETLTHRPPGVRTDPRINNGPASASGADNAAETGRSRPSASRTLTPKTGTSRPPATHTLAPGAPGTPSPGPLAARTSAPKIVKPRTSIPPASSPGTAGSRTLASHRGRMHSPPSSPGSSQHPPREPRNTPYPQDLAAVQKPGSRSAKHPGSRSAQHPGSHSEPHPPAQHPAPQTGPEPNTPRELQYSVVAPPRPLITPKPFIADTALRSLARKIAAEKIQGPIGGKKDRSLHIDRPLQIGLLVAPDFTSVKSVEGDKPGHSFGLTLGYQLARRLSLNTGIIFNRKNYTAPGDDFHPPPNSWVRNSATVDLHYVKGTVNMLEIPLTMRYDLTVADNGYFYVAGGISSYFVGQENCQYYYDNFGMPRWAPERHDDGSHRWLGALNLALGLEKTISRSFSIQAEPYVKLPLSGVGFGDVQLNSFGINFSLKYSPHLGRSRK